MFDKRLFDLVWQLSNHRAAFLLCILCAVLGGMAIVGQSFLLSRIVQEVFLLDYTLIQVSDYLIWLLIFILLRFFLSLAKDFFADRYTKALKIQLRERILSHLLQLGPIYIAQEQVGEALNTVVEGIEALDSYFREWLPQLWIAVISPIIIILVVVFYDPLTALIFALTAPLIPVFMVLIGKAASGLTQKQWNALSRMSAVYLELLQGLTMLKALNRSRQQVEVIEALGDDHEKVTMKVLRVAFLSALSLELVATISTAIVAVGVGLRLLYGFMNFENALFVLFLAPEFYLPLRLLGLKFHSAIGGVSAASRVFEILSIPLPTRHGKLELRKPIEKIYFHEVSFSYRGQRHESVRDVSFEILPRSLNALVGPSGSGKSTLVAILLGFIQPDHGEVFVNDVPLSQLDMEWWRSKISWVSQNPYLFHGTIIENIRLANPQASMEELAEAAKLAHAHEFIQALPQGYETVIGERGFRLSVGEAQRLALARAFLKKDNLLLIVDEPTSALDVESEKYIQQALSFLAQRMSVLVIAHRLATVYQADQILVLSQGCLVQSGKHKQLIEEEGKYRQLVTGYKDHEKTQENEYFTLKGVDGEHEKPARDFHPIPLCITPRHQERTSMGSSFQTSRLFDMLRWVMVRLPFYGRLHDYQKKQVARFMALHAELLLPIGLSIVVGSLTILSSISLMSSAAFIISAAALRPSIADLNVAIVGVRFFGIARGFFRYAERLISHRATLKLLTRLRGWFYSVLEPLVPAQLVMTKSADIYERINNDITSLDQFYLRVTFPPLVALLVVASLSIFFAFFAFPLNYVLWAAIFCAGVITPLVMFVLSRSTGKAIVNQRGELTSAVMDFLQGMADILIFQAEQKWLHKIKHIQQAWIKAQSKMALLQSLQSSATTLWANLAVWAALFVLIPLVNQQLVSGILLAVLLMALLSSFEIITPLPQAAQFLEANREAAVRLIEIARTVPQVVNRDSPAPMAALRTLVFHNVSFRYGDQDPNVLDDVSFYLAAGKKLAIVGGSGAGKSSLLNLILRFWNIQAGEILWNGQSISSYPQEDLRDQLGVLPQRIVLFNMAVKDHFRLANPNVQDREIFRVCKAVQMHDRICALPRGYDTVIGERGGLLSAGERQRIGLAMALLRQASLLILDEPTAHLDSLTELEVINSILPFIYQRALIWITHRLVGLEVMDEILVMKKGRIIERGQHAQLLAQKGEYYRMIELQSQYLNERIVRTS